ncbi:MAG: anti-sigma factor [Thermoanaerobaculia bacterium]
MNADQLHEDLDLELDGALEGPAREALLARLAEDPALAEERERLVAVHSALAAARITPRAGFASEVVQALPAAAWEGRTMSAWRWPFAMLLVIGGAAAALFGGAAAELESAAPSLTAFAALARLFSSALLAGAGLLGATWSGLGIGLAQWLLSSRLHLLAAALVLVGLNVLLVRLLRPTERRAAGAIGRGAGERRR